MTPCSHSAGVLTQWEGLVTTHYYFKGELEGMATILETQIGGAVTSFLG